VNGRLTCRDEPGVRRYIKRRRGERRYNGSKGS
jgi:hypothetical protein